MSHSSKKIIIAALIGNFLIAVSKFFAAWFAVLLDKNIKQKYPEIKRVFIEPKILS